MAADERSAARVERAGFRRDIEGLRGVAVLLVILYHSHVPGMTGGFVGVDVFFVISGFVITGTLLREMAESATIRVGRFLMRRVRRLLPALALMVAATLAAGALILSPLEWKNLARDSASAVLYLSNVVFARSRSGYFGGADSPLLHTWSLSVEEQFYLGWPLLFLIAVKVSRARAAVRRRLIVVLTTAATALSFAFSLVLSQRGTPWAYLSAPTRAWEFGSGALLALAATRLVPLAQRVTWPSAAAGLVLILIAANRFDSLTSFPGLAALVPVAGTALVLFAGLATRPLGFIRALATPPLAFLGSVSYSWYLWHWPVLVLGVARYGPLTSPQRLLMCGAALAVGILSNRYVENPIRYSHRLARPSATAAIALAVVLTLVGASLSLSKIAGRRLAEPYLARLADVRNGRTATALEGCKPIAIKGEPLCAFGPATAAKTVMLVGDSHAAQWSPAVTAASTALGARTVVRTRGGCPVPDVRVRATGKQSASASCAQYRAETMRLIVAVDPDVIVMSNADFTRRLLKPHSNRILKRKDAVVAWATAVGAFAASVQKQRIPLVVILDNPSMPTDPIACLARYRADSQCSRPAQPLLSDLDVVTSVERKALASNGVAAVLETAPFVCGAGTCHAEDASGPIYSDSNHLSASFVLSHERDLRPLLAPELVNQS